MEVKNMSMEYWIRGQFGAGPKRSMPILSFPAVSLMGVTVRSLVADGELQARGMKLVADRCPASASVSMMDLSVEAEAFGCAVEMSDDEVPAVVGCLLRETEDVERLAVPPVSAGRCGRYVDAIRAAKTLIDDRPVFAGVIGPFSLAGRLMDMTEIMVNCYEEPDMVHAAVDKAAEFLVRYIIEYKKAGADGIVLAEPAAGLLSPEMCGEFSSVYVKRIRDAVRSDDFLFIYHNCGNTIPLLDSLLGIGADAYHLGNAVDIGEALRRVPGDVLIMGNLDPAGLFRLGTPESIRSATLELLGRCGAYGNFAISSGCDIPPLTPWENIDAFFDAVDEFYAKR